MAKRKIYKCDSYFHGECKVVPNPKSFWETVPCPWCEFPVSTNNIGKWCAGCYTLFKVEGNMVHFGKGLEKTTAVAFAIAVAKTGGTEFGKPNHLTPPRSGRNFKED